MLIGTVVAIIWTVFFLVNGIQLFSFWNVLLVYTIELSVLATINLLLLNWYKKKGGYKEYLEFLKQK